jgi:undecaprenyl-diphosphatase
MTHAIRQLAKLPALAWAGIMVLAVGMLAALVAGSPTVVALEIVASRRVHEEAVPALTEWSFMVSELAGSQTAIVVAIAAVIALVTLRHWRGALAVALAYGLTQGVVSLMKMVVERPRPDDALVEAGGFSFPSAHSATSIAVYGCLTFIVARAVRGSARVAVVLAGAAVVMAIGASRIYLGAHYPTDVVAGWLTGGLLVLAAWVVLTRLRVGEPREARA